MWSMPIYGEWGWIGMTLMLLVWAPVLGLVAWSLLRLGGMSVLHAVTVGSSTRARELLDRRYAASQLGRQQYLQMVHDIERDSVAANR